MRLPLAIRLQSEQHTHRNNDCKCIAKRAWLDDKANSELEKRTLATKQVV